MCPFCNTEKPIRSNGLAQVFLSNPHKVLGHVLVMPKRHVEKPWDLTSQELQACFELINMIEQRYIGKLGEGIDIRQSYWPFMQPNGLKARHVLFHVVPRSPDDYLFKLDQRKNPDDLYEELDEVEGDVVARLLQ